MSILDDYLAAVAAAAQAGMSPEQSAEAGLLAIAPLVSGIAMDVLRAIMKLAATPARPGWENITNTDDARAKLAVELAASGAALPET